MLICLQFVGGDYVGQHARKQAQLPLSKGGMGITSVYQSANAANVASLLTAHSDINRLQLHSLSLVLNSDESDEEKRDDTNDDNIPSTTFQYQSNTLLNFQYMNERDVDVLNVAGAKSIQQLCTTPSMHTKLQHKLVDKLNAYNYNQLQSSITPGHKAALLSCSQTGCRTLLIYRTTYINSVCNIVHCILTVVIIHVCSNCSITTTII